MELRKEPTVVKESGHTMKPKWVSCFSMYVAKNRYWKSTFQILGARRNQFNLLSGPSACGEEPFVTFCDSKYGLKWVWSKVMQSPAESWWI